MTTSASRNDWWGVWRWNGLQSLNFLLQLNFFTQPLLALLEKICLSISTTACMPWRRDCPKVCVVLSPYVQFLASHGVRHVTPLVCFKRILALRTWRMVRWISASDIQFFLTNRNHSSTITRCCTHAVTIVCLPSPITFLFPAALLYCADGCFCYFVHPCSCDDDTVNVCVGAGSFQLIVKSLSPPAQQCFHGKTSPEK